MSDEVAETSLALDSSPIEYSSADIDDPARPATSRWWPWSVMEQVASVVVVSALLIGTLGTLAGTAGRAFAGLNLAWEDQAGVLMLNIIAFLGGAIAFRRRRFITINWFGRFLDERGEQLIGAARDAATLAIAVVLTYAGWIFSAEGLQQTDPYLHIREFWVDLPLPVGMTLLALFCIERLILNRTFRIHGIGIACVLIGILAFIHFVILGSAEATACIALAGVLTLFLIAVGFPLPVAFSIGGVTYAFLGGTPLIFSSSDLLDGLSSFILVAIPFFLFTGFLMGAGGLSDRLAGATRVLFRRVPGGLLHVIVVSMFVFSGISGSKVGDMAAIGKSAVRMAKQENYPPEEAVAALAAGAAMGDTIPPSIALIVLASISSISLGALFAGGIFPACAVAVALLALILFRNRHRQNVLPPTSARARRAALVGALPVMAVPVLIVGGIVSGIATPTEVSAVAVLVAVVFVMGLYRKISFRQMLGVTLDSAILSGVVLLMLASATLFARGLILAQLPQELAKFAASNLGSKWAFLVVSTVICVVMGMIMEGLPALLVFAPLFIPVAQTLGINSVQYGIVVVMAIGIGVHTPPIGVGLFVGAQIGEVDIRSVCRRFYPYLIPLYVGLVLVICFPSLVLWLPNALHLS